MSNIINITKRNKKPKVDQSTIKLHNLAADIDIVLRDAIMNDVSAKDVMGLVAHRLAILVYALEQEDKVKYFNEIEKFLRQIYEKRVEQDGNN